MAPLVQMLNNHGVHTVGSCCGHGKGPGSIEFMNEEGEMQEIPLKEKEDDG